MFDTLSHAVDTFFGERQAIEHGAFKPGRAGGGEVFLVGGNQRGTFAADGGGDGQQGGVFFSGRRHCRAPGGGARLAANGLHVVLYIHDFH